MKKIHTAHTVRVLAFTGVFIAGAIFGKLLDVDSAYKPTGLSLEQQLLMRTEERVPLERATLEILLENKKESLALFQGVFATAFPKERELMVFTEKGIVEARKDIELLELWLYQWYGVERAADDEVAPVEVPAPR